jgi:hypothetical protein
MKLACRASIVKLNEPMQFAYFRKIGWQFATILNSKVHFGPEERRLRLNGITLAREISDWIK